MLCWGTLFTNNLFPILVQIQPGHHSLRVVLRGAACCGALLLLLVRIWHTKYIYIWFICGLLWKFRDAGGVPAGHWAPPKTYLVLQYYLHLHFYTRVVLYTRSTSYESTSKYELLSTRAIIQCAKRWVPVCIYQSTQWPHPPPSGAPSTEE